MFKKYVQKIIFLYIDILYIEYRLYIINIYWESAAIYWESIISNLSIIWQ